MKTLLIALSVFLFAVGLVGTSAFAATITFDAVVVGQTSFGFDGDGDSINDVIFMTTDGSGFYTIGPGLNMTYINEPGLEGTSLLLEDLRVDFLNGAVGTLSFGFALNSITEDDSATFSVYDSSDNLLGTTSEIGLFTLPDLVNPSSFPEGVISLAFGGIASYGIFDFTSDYGRYILDDFDGTFGSTEDINPVPEPNAALIFGIGLAVIGLRVRGKR